MISETDLIREFTIRYFGQPGKRDSERRLSPGVVPSGEFETDNRRSLTPDGLMILARSARELLNAPVPSSSAASRAAHLFDVAASSIWPLDEFGERYEVSALLAFVGWRNAAASGLEGEAQEWLRMADMIVGEEAVGFECLTSFLYLPDEGVTAKLESRFLAKPEDIFLSLSILKRDRYRNPSGVVTAASRLYRRITNEQMPGVTESETQFFLGEAALLAGGLARVVGSRRTASAWLIAALDHFGRCPSNQPLIAKVKLSLATLARDFHEYDESEQWRHGLLDRFLDWGMAREAFTFRLLEALILKARGATDGARKELSSLADDLRHAWEPSLLAAVLGPLGELACKSGDYESGLKLLHEALLLASNNGDSPTGSSICLMIGECEAARGQRAQAVEWFNAGMAAAESGGCSLQLAYFRVFVADEMVASSQNDEARTLLRLAIPVLKEQKMIPESIRAIRLLQTIDSLRPSRCDNPKTK